MAQRGKMESGEVCTAADDAGGSNMLLDLEVGRRIGRVEPVSPVICAKSRSTGLGRAGPGKCGAHNYHLGSIRLIVELSASRAHRVRGERAGSSNYCISLIHRTIRLIRRTISSELIIGLMIRLIVL